MAAVSSADASRSADSYIGSLISLTSKSEIRYEGVLSSINVHESSIGLGNVRSFGTEGRKKDGPQIAAMDKIYEYIIFRGSDIKDLQVKAPPPPPRQTALIHNDPAIIQSHYSHPGSALGSLPPAGIGATSELSSQTAQLGLPRSPFQGNLPLYPPGGGLGPWGSSALPPPANGSGLAMPMYWQGYYAPPSGALPHLQQPHVLHPPAGLSVPSMQQSLQYSGINAALPSGSSNFAEFPSPLLPSSGVAVVSAPAPTMMPSGSITNQSNSLPPEPPLAKIETKTSTVTPSAPNFGANLFLPPSFSSIPEPSTSQCVPPVVNSNTRIIATSNLVSQPGGLSVPSVEVLPRTIQVENSVPLVTPGQLMQPGPPALTSEILEEKFEKHEGVLIKADVAKSLEPTNQASLLVTPKTKEPILPLHQPPTHKLGGSSLHAHQVFRGRGRGRRNGYGRAATKYTEDFDFEAMNEKFNKDEVWGHLGKGKDGDTKDVFVDTLVEDDEGSANSEAKPVYVKDDFFDSLSCETLDRTRGARTKFSEQLKIDTETFGSFPRHRAGRSGGRGVPGGRARGPYYGRGGYGYSGGRGRNMQYRSFE